MLSHEITFLFFLLQVRTDTQNHFGKNNIGTLYMNNNDDCTINSPSNTSILPTPPPPNLPNHIHQSQQHRHLNQRPHRTRKRLIALSPKRRHRHRNRQFEIITRGREALRRRQLVSETQLMRHEQSEEKHDAEVNDQRGGDSDHGNNLVHDAVALGGEEDEDGKEEADQGPRTEVFQENGIVPPRADELSDCESSDNSSHERYTEEDRHARRDGRVRHTLRCRRTAATDDADEEDSQRRIEDHLQNGIDRDEDSAIFVIAAREPRPYKHHGNTARQTHENEPLPQPLFIRQESPRERKHECRRYDPVHGDGKGDLDPHLLFGQRSV